MGIGLSQRLGRTSLARDIGRAISYTGATTFQPLRAPLTHTSFDGDSFSDVGSSTKIENSSWSDTIPTTAVALLMEIRARDSDSAANDAWIVLGPSVAEYQAGGCFLGGMKDDTWKSISQVIPCTDGDVWYQCESTGATTLDIVLQVWGYWT